MAWLAVLSLGATPQSAASAPSTEAEFRAAGDASSAAFESSSDVSKTADVPRQLRDNCTTRQSCAPAVVVGLIGAIFSATVMMMAATSSPAEARGLSSTARGDDGPVTAQRAGFESIEFMKECVRLPRPAHGGGGSRVTLTLSL